MFLDDLEPLEKSFYRPKNQYSRLEQIIAVLIVFLPVATVPATVSAKLCRGFAAVRRKAAPLLPNPD